MARPEKKNADYFSHDKEMRNDPKMKHIRNIFGLEGYAVFCMLLEHLTNCDGFECKLEAKSKKLLSGDFLITVEKLEEMISEMVEVELFELKDEVLSSNGLKKRFEPLLKKRELMKQKYKNGGVSEAETTQSKVKQSKVKIKNKSIREDNIKIIERIKQVVEELGLVYSGGENERIASTNIRTSKNFTKIASGLGISNLELAEKVVLASIEDQFRKGKIYNCQTIYNHYAKIINNAKAKFDKLQSSIVILPGVS